MKKLRFLFTMLLLSVVSIGFAESITFGELNLNNSQQYTDPFDGGSFTVTFAGGDNDGKYYDAGSAIRVYGGGTMTVSAKSGKITGITITYDGTYKPTDNDVVSTGTYTASTGVWTGEAASVVFTRPSGSGHWRVKKVEVTITGGVQKEPAGLYFEETSFTVGPGEFFTAPYLNNPNNLEVTYTTSDEEIAHVSEDGYVNIGNKLGTATITASSEETDKYWAGKASYTITVKGPALENIAALSEQAEKGNYDVILDDAVVTYVNGSYAYIQDASGAIVMYKNGHNFIAGQVLKGTATAAFQLYNGNPQITNLSGEFTINEGTAPEPTEIVAADWDTPIVSVLSQYFKIKCATLTKENNNYYVQLGDEKVQLYGRGDAETISVVSLDPTFTIIGFPTKYVKNGSTTPELQIFVQPQPEQMVLTVPTPTFNPAAGAVEAGTEVTIVCPEGADGVEYILNQNPATSQNLEWTAYTAPIKMTETTTVYARAYKNDSRSEIVSATYTVKEDVVIEEEGKTTFLFNTQGNEWGFPTEYTKDAAQFTANGKTIGVYGGNSGYKFMGNCIILGKKGAYLSLPAFNFSVGKIEIVGTSSASTKVKQNIFVGDVAVSDETTGAKNVTNEYLINPNYRAAGNIYTLKINSDDNTQISQIIVYKATAEMKVDAELSYDVETFTAYLDEQNEFPVLNNPNNLNVTYSSSETDVATINENGEISLLNPGETTITATFDGDDGFKAGSATYQLNVEELDDPEPADGVYELVTDASTLNDGDIIIIAYVDPENMIYQAMSAEQGNNNRPAVEVSYDEEDGTLTPNSDAQIITLESDAEYGWYFNVSSGYLYAASSGSNWLRTEDVADENAKAEISIDENGDATIVFQGMNTRNNMRYNENSGSPIFSCYAENSSVQALPRIYRKVAGEVAEEVSITIGSSGFATLFYSNKSLVIPEGVKAMIVTSVDKGIKFEELEGYIPAGTGVVIQGVEGTHKFVVDPYYEGQISVNNMLNGSDKVAMTVGGGLYYKLSLDESNTPGTIGFYWGAENGGEFENGAHKAYLVVPEEMAAKSYCFSDLLTTIRNVSSVAKNADIYTVSGVRVSGNVLPKGIYIVNGKKMVVK